MSTFVLIITQNPNRKLAKGRSFTGLEIQPHNIIGMPMVTQIFKINSTKLGEILGYSPSYVRKLKNTKPELLPPAITHIHGHRVRTHWISTTVENWIEKNLKNP